MRLLDRIRAGYWWITRVLARRWFHWGFQGTLEKQARRELSHAMTRFSRWPTASFEEAGRVLGVQATNLRQEVPLALVRSVKFRYRHYDGWHVQFFVDPLGLGETDWWRVRRRPRELTAFLGEIDSADVVLFMDRVEQHIADAAARAADLVKRETDFIARLTSESESHRRLAEQMLTTIRNAEERHQAATEKAWTTIRNAMSRLPGLTLRVSEQQATVETLRDSYVRSLNDQRASQRAVEESLRVISEIATYPPSPVVGQKHAEWVQKKGAAELAMRLRRERERTCATADTELATRGNAVALEQDVIIKARAEWTRSEDELRKASAAAAATADQCEDAASVAQSLQNLRAAATAAGLDARKMESVAVSKRHWLVTPANTLDAKRVLGAQLRQGVVAATTRLNDCRRRVDSASTRAQPVAGGTP